MKTLYKTTAENSDNKTEINKSKVKEGTLKRYQDRFKQYKQYRTL